MAQFSVLLGDSQNIATQEQGDEFFSDANESANTVEILPPVYSRTNWSVGLRFKVERDPPDPETGEETDTKSYTITDMRVNTVAFYANGEPIPLDLEETTYNGIDVYSNTGTQEIIIPGTPEVEGIPAVSAVGETSFTTPGTYTWTCPANVTSVCAVAVGGGGGAHSSTGGGGGGGGLAWRNNISVTPGQSYTVIVGTGGLRGSTGQDGGNSSVFSMIATGGQGGAAPGGRDSSGGTFINAQGGGNGGKSYSGVNNGGGGGAGGYSGNGGDSHSTFGANGQAGQGGGGGGGCQASASVGPYPTSGGGGVGIFGEGPSGAGGIGGSSIANSLGRGGSGGSDGINPGGQGGGGIGGAYGGGGGSFHYGSSSKPANEGSGAGGAVRIIWGDGRAFPATRTATEPATAYIPGTDPVPATEDTIEYVIVGTGESIGAVNMSEFESPFNDTWQYLTEDKEQVTVSEVDELPEPKTYLGVFSWNNPNPDYILVVRGFEILAEDNLGGNYTFNASLRQGYYFSYTPYITAIPREVNKGKW